MPGSFPSRQDASLMVALVVAAVMAAMSLRERDPAPRLASETGSREASGEARDRSPLIDYLNAVGAADEAADPSATTIAALLAP
jgi:hypothetical protein